MKTINMYAVLLFSIISIPYSFAQNNRKQETIKIFGNCGMCKAKIEKAANQKNISQVEWNEETGLAVIKFDATKTSKEDISEIVRAEIAFLAAVKRKLGDQKIDVLVNYPSRKMYPPIFEVAKQQGIAL